MMMEEQESLAWDYTADEESLAVVNACKVKPRNRFVLILYLLFLLLGVVSRRFAYYLKTSIDITDAENMPVNVENYSTRCTANSATNILQSR